VLVFNRESFTQLWITIRSNESLAILNSGYVEDYFGVDGQLTLHNMTDGTRISFVMNEDIDETPSIPHDVFSGFLDLTTLDNGLYRIEGRVRDGLGNYRILSDFQSPNGTEDVTLFELQISPTSIVVFVSKDAQIFQKEKPSADLYLVAKPEANVEIRNLDILVDLLMKLKPDVDIVMKQKPEAAIRFNPTPEVDIINVYTEL
jgi:hypothetical protein